MIKRAQSSEGTLLEIHRSLQLNLLLDMTKEPHPSKRQEIYEEVLSMLGSILPAASRLQQNEKDIWPSFNKYVPQVLSLYHNSQWPDPPIDLDFRFAKILSNIGTFLWHTGQIRECDSVMNTSIAIIQAQSKDFQNTLECQTILSDIYLVTGIIADCIGVSRRQQSLDQRKLLLEMRERELKAIVPRSHVTVDDEIRWGNAKGDLACAYMQRGRYEDAKEIMTELLGWYQKWGSEDEYPYEYAKYYLYLGYILMTEGKPTEALEHARKGLELDIAHAGDIDSTVLITRYDVASLLFNAGKVQESLDMHEETLENRVKICGRNSQFTSESYEAVGILSHLLGKNPRAAKCFEICLSSHCRANWTTEGVARARYWYSKVLKALGDKIAANTELKLALAVKAKFLNQFPEFLQEDAGNPETVFDQMLPMWMLQLSGALQKGGRNPIY